jgi:hypothetical protein
MTSDVDIFDDLSNPAPVGTGAEAASEDQLSEANTESADSQNSGDTDNDESPVETVAQVPDGAMSITEFAAFMTKTLMKEKFEAGEDLDMSEYVVPQSVYQTVKAQRDRIPHVLVKGADDTEARVYILTVPATEWWKARKERLATRGSGAQRASSRTPEDNLNLLATAVNKSLYAIDRRELWVNRVAQTAALVDKYRGFLNDAKVAEETIELAIQEATDQYNADKAEKEAEKASKKGSKDKTDED